MKVHQFIQQANAFQSVTDVGSIDLGTIQVDVLFDCPAEDIHSASQRDVLAFASDSVRPTWSWTAVVSSSSNRVVTAAVVAVTAPDHTHRVGEPEMPRIVDSGCVGP